MSKTRIFLKSAVSFFPGFQVQLGQQAAGRFAAAQWLK
jgi:hypothetical protein